MYEYYNWILLSGFVWFAWKSEYCKQNWYKCWKSPCMKIGIFLTPFRSKYRLPISINLLFHISRKTQNSLSQKLITIWLIYTEERATSTFVKPYKVKNKKEYCSILCPFDHNHTDKIILEILRVTIVFFWRKKKTYRGNFMSMKNLVCLAVHSVSNFN